MISLFSVRSERTFCEELGYNLLFRRFLDVVEPGFDPGVFSKNRQQRLVHAVGQALFDEVVGMAYQQDLLSDHHFAVDGTLIEAAPGFKTFRSWDEDDDPGNPNPVPVPPPSGCRVGSRPDSGVHSAAGHLQPAVLPILAIACCALLFWAISDARKLSGGSPKGD